MSPAQVADKATSLLRQLAELGEVIKIDQLSDPSRFQVACNCTPPVDPDRRGPVIVIHPPVPPLDYGNVLNALTMIAAVNQMQIPAMKFGNITVTVASSPMGAFAQ